MNNRYVTINRPDESGAITVANDLPLVLFAGPCAMESREHALMVAGTLKGICDRVGIALVYKSSFDKANRTSLSSARGVGLEEGMEILAEVRSTFNLPVMTDIHDTPQCDIVARTVDVLQTPAFLCRQTDFILAAAEAVQTHGRALNVKKGQFLAPHDMKNVAAKVATRTDNFMLCERGASFGYNTLVSDMRALPIMAETGYPVVFDATHSVQQPGGNGTSSGGDRRFVPVLARSAVAAGVAALFMETHEQPDRAPSDGPNMVPLEAMEPLLRTLVSIDRLMKPDAYHL